MSLITDLALLTNSRLEVQAMVRFHGWCDEHASGQRFGLLPVGSWDLEESRGFKLAAGGAHPRTPEMMERFDGGAKDFGKDVWACGGNYFPWADLLEALPSFGWKLPRMTVLLAKPESADHWVGILADGSEIPMGGER